MRVTFSTVLHSDRQVFSYLVFVTADVTDLTACKKLLLQASYPVLQACIVRKLHPQPLSETDLPKWRACHMAFISSDTHKALAICLDCLCKKSFRWFATFACFFALTRVYVVHVLISSWLTCNTLCGSLSLLSMYKHGKIQSSDVILSVVLGFRTWIEHLHSPLRVWLIVTDLSL